MCKTIERADFLSEIVHHIEIPKRLFLIPYQINLIIHQLPNSTAKPIELIHPTFLANLHSLDDHRKLSVHIF